MSADKDQQAPPAPNNRKANAKLIKVRVVGQSIHHEGKAYHGPSKKGEPERKADTFLATQEDVDRYGERFVEVVEE